MYKFTMIATDNPQEVESLLSTFNNRCFVITLEEQGSIFNLSLPNFTKGTILLPPPTAEIAAIDGDENRFSGLYYMHLIDLSTLEFISLMLYTAYFSMPVILYIPKENAYAGKYLTDFLLYNFEVPIVNSTLTNGFYVSPIEANSLALFYVFNFIDINIFLNEYRVISNKMDISFVPLQDLCLDKFCIETNYIPDPNCVIIDQVRNSKINHFINIVNSDNKIIPFTMEGPQC